MTLTAAGGFAGERRPRLAKSFFAAATRTTLDRLVMLWIFSGGIILFEPSLYEFFFIPVLLTAGFAGLKLNRSMLSLLIVFMCFVPFAMIAAFQPKYNDAFTSIIFAVVTIFLMLTAFFIGNYVAEAPTERTRLIMRAYTAIAVISALIGLLAYLHLLPGADLFVRYGRAKAMFKDPNVFAPFLILPAAFAAQKIFLGNGRRAFWAAVVFGILFLGVFASFSRAAWGHLLATSMLVFLLCFWLEAKALDKVRMMIIAMVGVFVLVAALIGLLSIPSVGELFAERASLEQNYDTGSTGRFGRQAYAFELALANPWGIGPGEFRNLRIVEEPHNSYVSTIHVYGWGGGLCYYVMVILTLWRGLSGLRRNSPNRLLLIPVMAVYIPLIIEAGIIDTDHWRHYFLVTGLVWGVTAIKGPFQRTPLNRNTALV